jgi:alanyl-tRNA synthetase
VCVFICCVSVCCPGVSGSIAVGDSVTVKVDYGRRGQIVPNHTMTHVLNFALRETLGDHVDQKGSIVLPDK